MSLSLKADPVSDRGYVTQRGALHARTLSKRKAVSRNRANVALVCSWYYNIMQNMTYYSDAELELLSPVMALSERLSQMQATGWGFEQLF